MHIRSALVLAVSASSLLAQEPELSGVVAIRPDRFAGGGAGGPANVGPNFRMNQDTGTRAQNETFIAVNPKDPFNLIGSANDYRPGDARAALYVTLNGGATIVNDGVFALTAPYQASGDPSVAFDGAGNGYICFLEFRRSGRGGALFVAKTTNKGLAFTKSLAFQGPSGHLPDKPMLTGDTRTTGPSASNLYISFTGFYTSPSGINIIRSTDGGASWSSPIRLGSGQGSHVGTGPNGEVYCTWQSGNAIVLQRSLNGGTSFLGQRTVAVIARNPSPLPPTRFRCNSFPSIAVDKSNGPFRGRVYVLWSSRSGSSSEIFASFSTNQGLTWSAPRRVNDVAAGDQFFQWAAVDQYGTVFSSWFDRRNDPSNVLYDCYASASYDGGLSWVKNWRVSSQQSNPNIGFSGTFIGDYSATAANGGAFYATWMDTRRGQQDAFASRIQSDLEFGPASLSAAAGGTISLPIKAGPNHRNQVYILLAGISGTSPGLDLGGGVKLHLNFDAITNLSLLAANLAPFLNTVGTLDNMGMPATQPSFPAPAGYLTPIANRTLSFAYLLLNATPAFGYGSNAVNVKINP